MQQRQHQLHMLPFAISNQNIVDHNNVINSNLPLHIWSNNVNNTVTQTATNIAAENSGSITVSTAKVADETTYLSPPAPAVLHISNKNNLAKLHWWNAPPKTFNYNNNNGVSNSNEIQQSPEKQQVNECLLSDSPITTVYETMSQLTTIATGVTTNLQMTISQNRSVQHLVNNNNIKIEHLPFLHYINDQTNTLKQQIRKQVKSIRTQSILDQQLGTQSELQQESSVNVREENDYCDVDNCFQDSLLLTKDPKPYTCVLNLGEEDEMLITGYRRSGLRTFLCWACICLTAGLLRLVLHWWRHWYLIATHELCPLSEAEKVLLQEDYQGKHKTFYVKPVQVLDVASLRESRLNQQSDIDNEVSASKKDSNNRDNKTACLQIINDAEEKNFQLSVHFSSGQFKRSETLRIFDCKRLRYAWDSQTNSFQKINGLDTSVPNFYFYQQRGLSTQEQLSRRLVYGANEITVPYKDLKTLLFLEVLNPFYVFQIFSVILWFAYNYYYYACVILLMSVFGISMTIIQTKKNQDALRETVKNAGDALVVNDHGQVKELPTEYLVPGDIIEIPSIGCTMQCDAVLLSGNCILDESMLTGESIPITKTPLPHIRPVTFDKKQHSRHTLFCGTKVMQTRYIGSEKVLAIVINTGNVTAKGGLIRSILYPPPVDYKFEQDSYKFISCLALIALVGFLYTLVSKILREIDPVKIAVESLDLITIVVPPALPAAMTVGRFYAQKRLELENIYCISPRSINVAGGIDCCCFDKTGTLTEDGLDMWGVVPKSATNQFQIPIKQIERLPYDNFLFGMVTCHSITIMNGKMMGDPLDLKMFESTGWTLEDPKDIPDNQKFGLIHPTIVRQPKNSQTVDLTKTMHTKLNVSVDDLLADVGLLHGECRNDHGIVREFPFSSNLQRMSVITRRLSEQNFNIYCKGSPEMLQQLCVASSLPENYSQQLAVYAKQGYRIIAMGYKPLSRKLNYTKIQRLAREVVETDLEFLGFVILENRLKPDTSEVIRSLNAANIRTVMVTGDNILTALSVARDCGIVSSSQAVITVHVRHNNNTSDEISKMSNENHNYELYYTLELGNSDNPLPETSFVSLGREQNLDCCSPNEDIMSLNSSVLPNSSSLSSVQTYDTWTHQESLDKDIELGDDFNQKNMGRAYESNIKSWRHNYRFAMVGNTWQIVHDHFPQQLSFFVTRGAIFARMSPEQKQALIMEFQNLDYCVAMCGDGANDCGALKVAHTGISLSETESSIASPFTSRSSTIACVPNVIKEGRAALVTSFGIFKYMATYSMIQFISVMILYSIDSNLTDKQYLYIDLGLITIFAFFFGKTEAYAGHLVKQVPLSSLISLTPLVSLLTHLAVVVGFQVAGWYHLHEQSWFKPFVLSDEDHLGCYENYTMFAISSFQYIILAFVFSKGAPYRKPVCSNMPFCLSIVLNVIIVIYLIVYPMDWIASFFQLILPPVMSFRYWMLIYGLFIFVSHVLVETCLIEALLFKHVQVRRDQNWRTSKRQHMRVEHNLLYSCPTWPPISETCEAHVADSSPNHTAENKATYVEISAQQTFEHTTPSDNALNSFFEVAESSSAHVAQNTYDMNIASDDDR